MQIQLLRHATLVLRFGAHTILVDPMLSHAGTMEPVANAANARRIPLVELPLDKTALADLLGQIDLILVTHTHRDHWDSRAVELLRKDIPLFGQPADVERFHKDGFTAVRGIEDQLDWQGVQINRTGGQHGTGEIGQRMGPVSGFVLQADGEPTLYIAGDTIWCPEVEAALSHYQPDVTVVNAGAAQFLSGDPITMTDKDVVQVCRALPSTRVIAVHMEAVNHCLLLRSDLRSHLEREGCTDQVSIPLDGDTIVC